MEASAGLVAGFHNRNELIVIRDNDETKALKSLDGQVCEICSVEVGLMVDGDLFMACNECGLPVCRPCHEYVRWEGNQQCPRCMTRYKRLEGSSRVQGDEDEDDIDDIENDFKIEDERNKHDHLTEAMVHVKMSCGRGPEEEVASVRLPPGITDPRSRHVSGEFPLSSNSYGEQTMLPPSLPKKVHRYYSISQQFSKCRNSFDF